MAEESTQTSTWLLNCPEIPNGGNEKNKKHTTSKDGKKRSKPWSKLHPIQKILKIVGVLFRISTLLGILYCFVCALGLLEDAFQLLGGRTAGETFRNSQLLSNPVAGLMIGVLATVLVQSSSTATSIVVAMVASEVIPLHSAIPIIMGTNVGTSITSTLVSLAQAGERSEFRRAFAGATVHDMFNWSAVIILLPLEVASGYLYHLTRAIVSSLDLHVSTQKPPMLTSITEPFVHLIVEINRDVITDIAMEPNVTEQSSVMKRWCQVTMTQKTVSVMRYDPVEVDCSQVTRGSPFYSSCTSKNILNTGSSGGPGTMGFFLGWNETEVINSTLHRTKCSNLFAFTDLTDKAAGVILLVIAIIVILSSLFGIVKILNSMLQGSVAKVIQRTVNADFPGKFAYFTGYVALLVGCGLTVVIQSSSVFTSTLTPLVGVGIVSVERMYPMTLGSNIGTTVTGILAAMSVKGKHSDQALQIALCHLFFNLTAVAIFYPIPFMRFPIPLAKMLGRITSKYRWFAGVYLVGMFLVIPVIVFALSYAGWIYLLIVGGPLFLLFLVVTIINVLQVKHPNYLPLRLRNWEFLPLFCHSCSPYDRIISCHCLTAHCPKFDDSDDEEYDDDSEEIKVPEVDDHFRRHPQVIAGNVKGQSLSLA
ncbi:unnamed protein product [Candidula unifasciata]|uniref:Uncharacterized protein n=1 Tax=Candidula unifasciata TaxID=100452 RepID=A0A8S3YGF6_9EUPU|nr:unnamed protein product [Candidula unifasciata]